MSQWRRGFLKPALLLVLMLLKLLMLLVFLMLLVLLGLLRLLALLDLARSRRAGSGFFSSHLLKSNK
jgi:hypothetical protein